MPKTQVGRKRSSPTTPIAPHAGAFTATLDAGGWLWSKASLVLAIGIFLFGTITAFSTAVIVYRTFSPIIDWDQWAVVSEVVQHNGHITLGWLWAQHNEHRIPLGKLACYADLRFFGGKNISLLFEIYAIQGMESLFLLWMFRKFSTAKTPLVLTAAGVFVFCMFSPIQIENFYAGFQVTFVLLPFFACLAIAALALYADRISSQPCPTLLCWQLLASLACAWGTQLSLASGIFIWPVLLVLSFMLKLPANVKYLVGVVGACAVATFLWGYQVPYFHANPAESLQHPTALVEYVRAYFGWSWDPAIPIPSALPTLAQWCAIVAVLVVIVSIPRLILSRAWPSTLEAFLLANMAFLFLTALTTAMGRINLNLEQAASSRYQTIALGFWASFLGLILWRRAKESNPARLVELQVVLLLLLLASIPRFSSSAAAAEDRRMRLAHAYGAYIEHPSSPEAAAAILQNVSPFAGFPDAYNYLLSHHLGPDVSTFRSIQGSLSPLNPTEKVNGTLPGFQVISSDQCLGTLDSVARIEGSARRVIAKGWAWNLRSDKPPSRVMLVMRDGIVAGSGAAQSPRRDVHERVAQVRDLNTGWSIETELSPGESIRAFAISDDGKYACPLEGEFTRKGL